MKSSVSTKRSALTILLIVVSLLLIALPYIDPGDLPYVLLMVGRFHPVFLHFPIVLIILALVLEILRKSNMLRRAGPVIAAILLVACLSSIIAIASGFLLYASGDYAGELMGQHMWTGILTGTFILITSAFYFIARNHQRFYAAYMAGLVISNGFVALASHLGGSLTHGEDYLTEYLPLIGKLEKNKVERTGGDMLVYDDVLVSVFEAKCYSCHNDSRAKGEFSMTSIEKIIRGGESGNSGLVTGKADSSEIYKRLILPEGDEDRMPPEGKAPMTSAEVALLRAWINSGADATLTTGAAVANDSLNSYLREVLPSLDRYRRARELTAAKDEKLEKELKRLAFRLHVDIKKDSASDEGLYAVAMKFPPALFSGEQLRELTVYGGAFSKLSLVSSGIKDEALYHMGKLPNVKALYLQKTGIDGSGLVHLRNMPGLEVLNLSYTDVDDKAALELLNIPNLREVYLFRTKTSPEVVKALQAYKPSLSVLLEEGPYW